MKKFLTLCVFAAALSVSSVADAQLRVTKDGQVRIGNYGMYYEEGVEGCGNLTVDSTANLVILPSSDYFLGGTRLSLGAGGVSLTTPAITPGQLQLKTTYGLIYKDKDDVVFYYNNGFSDFEPIIGGLVFNKDITVPTTWTTSDARLKKDITPLDGEGVSLMDLTPVSYRLAPKAVTADAMSKEESLTAEQVKMPADERTRFGFIAQEVQKLYPELVKADENGMLAIDYIGFVPLLVDAVKNLTERVKVQDEMIKALAPATKYRPMAGDADMLNADAQGATLYQNRPNPFNMSTEIGCVVPQEVRDACIIIYDMQGKQLRRLPVSARGEVTVTVDGSTLTPGMYIYTLITDGAEVASKRMIITD